MSISEAMAVITARPRYFNLAIRTFTLIYTTSHIVSSRVLITAPIRYQVEKITLGITVQPTLYTDARPGMMPQRSGGLENSKFFIPGEQRSSTQKKHRFPNLDTPQFVYIFSF